MIILITALHVLACLALIMIVLLQTGKGADIGASMGGAGGQAMFGTSSATTMLSKITTGIAILFMLTSLFLAYQSGHRTNSETSVMDDLAPTVETTVPDEAPAVPASPKANAEAKDAENE